MRLSLTILLPILLLALAACRGTKQTASTPTTPDDIATTVEQVIQNEDAPILEEPPTPVEIAGLRKTACYGQCPVFEANVYSDGRVTYEGRRYANREGKFEAKADLAWLKALREAAVKAEYDSLEDTYPPNGQNIPDLPNTITFFNGAQGRKQITNNHDAPQALIEFEKFFNDALETLSWMRVSPLEPQE